jgi:CHAT domain-containing protein
MREFADSLLFVAPQLRAAVSQDILQLSEIQRLVPEGSALVVFAPTERSLYALVTTKEQSVVRTSSIDKLSLRTLMSAYGEALRRSNAEMDHGSVVVAQRRVADLASRLYQILVKPIDNVGLKVSRLLVVMPAGFPFVPVHAMRQGPRSGEYAIQKYSLRYLPFSEAILSKSSRLNRYPVVVGFGNQGRTSRDVEYEVRDAKAFYKDAKLYFNKDATLYRMHEVSGDILHAAFELVYRPQHTGNSFFLLNEGAGYFSLRYHRFGELFSVHPFSTVLLSNLNDAEPNIVVPTIFRMNGCEDVVLNGYTASRKAKKAFNAFFYTNLIAGASTEDAYRRALLEMIGGEEFALPNHWACFFLW